MAQWEERDSAAGGTSGNGNARQSAMMGEHDMDQAMERARTEMDRYMSMAADFIRERPVASLAGAIAIGFVVGRLASRR